jgi:hypothetical protein
MGAEIEERASKMIRICALWSQLPRRERWAVLWRAWSLIYGQDRVWEYYVRYRIHIIGSHERDNHNQGSIVALR